MLKCAWHYTTYQSFQQILKTGLLKSAALMIGEKVKAHPDWRAIKAKLEKPYVSVIEAENIVEEFLPQREIAKAPDFLRHKPIIWFSRRQDWEPQAGLLKEGKPANSKNSQFAGDMLSQLDTYRAGGGLIRLGLYENVLLPWTRLLIAAEFPLGLRLALTKFDKLSGGYNEKYVMGLVEDSIRLSEAYRIEMYEPEVKAGIDFGKWIYWNPSLTPKSLPDLPRTLPGVFLPGLTV